MRSVRMLMVAAGFGLAAGLIAAQAGAQDLAALQRDQVGTPLAPNDAAAEVWTLESQGRSLCQVHLSAHKVGGDVYAADMSGCAQSLPAGLAGWKPVTDGAALVDASGQIVIDFNRWSNSLLVSHQSSGVDLQLRRGT